MEWTYGAGPHIGPFTVQQIRPDGSARVGCHDITAAEARAFAAFMNWPPIDAPAESDAAEDSTNTGETN
jgi:hypothetical protein